ncbi:MAG: dTMP kinase [Clostridiales bacterium]
MKRGFFISFEGIDGCGKSTMLHLVEQDLQQRGYAVLATREPGDSDFGRAFRAMLLDSEFGAMDIKTETLLYAADRAQHVNEIIRPALDRGWIVLSDRYIDSTIAYQGGGRGLDSHFLQLLNNFATGGLMPDLTLYLRYPSQGMEDRLRGRKDRVEQETKDFFVRVGDTYEQLAEQFAARIAIIDATQKIPVVFAEISAKIAERLSWK